MSDCTHPSLAFTPSSHASEVGYVHPSPDTLFHATNPIKKTLARQPFAPSSTFPAPLVLPGDELSYDPHYEPQSAYECLNSKHWKDFAIDRRTIYVVPEPGYSEESEKTVRSWTRPHFKRERSAIPSKPKIGDVLAYLAAFYHAHSVKVLESPELTFAPWEEQVTSRRKKTLPTRIGLQLGSEEVIGIRHRPCKDGLYSQQLNLNDLLDAAMDLLPKDAYALLMLSDHDLYEDEEDDFCCGRAYGGSRVAIVSWARYNPVLDRAQRVETVHAWPASHCQDYMATMCSGTQPAKKKRKMPVPEPGNAEHEANDLESSAMRSALSAWRSLAAPRTAEDLSNLWLGRFCKTASHELGHCFGIDHCVYYACVMQGTSGLSEDARQPPYLCPIDVTKVVFPTRSSHAEQSRALLKFCMRFTNDRMFQAFGAWLRITLAEPEEPFRNGEDAN